MKKDLLLSLAATLLVFLLPLALPGRPLDRAEILPVMKAPAVSEPAAAAASPDQRAEPEAEAPSPSRRLRILADGEPLEQELEAYLVGVVAAEMPASFTEEALKAQAVAARTYALYCAEGHKHSEADLCTDPGCCQAWLGDQDLRDAWGEQYEQNLARVREAVSGTAGEILSYEGEPILAVFHSSSAGATEDCGAIWNPRPYLISVNSPEGAEDVPGYCSILRCAPIDFRDVILSAWPEADFSGPEENWIGQLERDGSGRTASLELGGVKIPGTELRRLFSLRSTAFTLNYEEGQFIFRVTGFGHGVGMSQYGAMVMARDGADYRQILAHYYPGAELQKGS